MHMLNAWPLYSQFQLLGSDWTMIGALDVPEEVSKCTRLLLTCLHDFHAVLMGLQRIL